MRPEKRSLSVRGHSMSYVELGHGRPIVFLHGNPTSSFLWRSVIPEVSALGRCIAPDLIGMGDSGKLPSPGPETYTLDTHRAFLADFLQAIGLEGDVVLVLHDWGSALGFDWANRHRNAVAGIAYMEAIVRPLAGWEEFSPAATPIFQALRSDAGEEMILDRNLFIERILTGSILRSLSEAELAEYRRPFAHRADRWPMLTFPRSIPIGGDPYDVVPWVQAYADWLTEAELPKLFINADPGAILTGAAREFCRSWPNQTEVTVSGSHFIQEDSGKEIGQAIAAWLRNTDL